MRPVEQLDSWISGKVKAWSSRVSGVPRIREILEIRRDILADVRDHIQPKGKGRTFFPYGVVAIRIAAENTEQRNLYEAAFGKDEIEEDVRGLLSEAECPVPAGFTAAITVVEDAVLASSARPFVIGYSKNNAVTAKAARPKARLAVVKGEADVTDYPIHSDRVNIGRRKEVVGDKDGVRRRNDVAFSDSETTVSREHACIRYDPDSGKFRLYDSGSQRGTSVFREGRRLQVPKGLAQGLQLRSRDEIHLGDARIVFESES